MTLEETSKAAQRKLRIEADGRAGPQTWGPIHAHIVKLRIGGVTPAEAITAVDARSEKVIATLLPEVRPFARAAELTERDMLAELRARHDSDEPAHA